MYQIFESRMSNYDITAGNNTNDIILQRLIEISNEMPAGSKKLMNKVAILLADFDKKSKPTVPIYWFNIHKKSWESSYRLNEQKIHLISRKNKKDVLMAISIFCKENDLVYPY